jgi:hypothetical protein
MLLSHALSLFVFAVPPRCSYATIFGSWFLSLCIRLRNTTARPRGANGTSVGVVSSHLRDAGINAGRYSTGLTAYRDIDLVAVGVM